jgi:hypothetical protein
MKLADYVLNTIQIYLWALQINLKVLSIKEKTI